MELEENNITNSKKYTFDNKYINDEDIFNYLFKIQENIKIENNNHDNVLNKELGESNYGINHDNDEDKSYKNYSDKQSKTF